MRRFYSARTATARGDFPCRLLTFLNSSGLGVRVFMIPQPMTVTAVTITDVFTNNTTPLAMNPHPQHKRTKVSAHKNYYTQTTHNKSTENSHLRPMPRLICTLLPLVLFKYAKRNEEPKSKM